MSAVHILKNTPNRAVVKFYGGSAQTLDLALSALLNSNEAHSGTYKAHIRALYWTVANNVDCQFGRWDGTNHEGKYHLGSGSGMIEHYSDGFSDNTYETMDFRLVMGGACTVIVDITKVSGYDQKVENATYGAYDDPTRIGASTTMNGSPDKV
jgi:hypothetical protein